MNRIKLFLLFATVALLLVACQPTPEKDVVIGKNNTTISGTQNSSGSNDYPDNWTRDFQNDEGTVTIQINAQLEIPNVSSYPVVDVVPTEITQNDIKTFVNYFFEGQTVYDTSSDSTKSELTKSLLQFQYDLETLEQSGKVHYTAHIFTSEEIPEEQAKIKSIIDDLKNQLSMAEDTKRNISNLDWAIKGEYKTCSVVNTVSGDYSSKLYISANDGNYDTRITYSKTDYSDYDDFEEPKDEEMAISLEEAVNTAKEMLADIGIEDAVITDWFVGNYTGFSEEITGIENSAQCYVLHFCKPVKGVPITYFYDYEGATTYDDQYAYPWEPEIIEVYVNNHGAVRFSWENIGTLTDTDNENVTLLPWEDIQETAIQQFRIKTIDLYLMGDDQGEMTIEINRITLGMMRVAKKDSSGEYMYVPVWDFFGNYIYQRESDSYSERACSMLTINATDGSIIDRGLGY
jgi:hypothetical protein